MTSSNVDLFIKLNILRRLHLTCIKLQSAHSTCTRTGGLGFWLYPKAATLLVTTLQLSSSALAGASSAVLLGPLAVFRKSGARHFLQFFSSCPHLLLR